MITVAVRSQKHCGRRFPSFKEPELTTDTASLFFALLTVGANVAAPATILLVLLSRRSRDPDSMLARANEAVAANALSLAWLVATIAMIGSLYYSEIANYTPCELCWYQRICMYPLTVILGIAALRKDTRVKWYVIPLATIGALISTYHYWLQRFPGGGSAFCTSEAPCTVTWVWKFHYISIPFMALSGFLLVLALMYAASGPKPTADLAETSET